MFKTHMHINNKKEKEKKGKEERQRGGGQLRKTPDINLWPPHICIHICTHQKRKGKEWRKGTKSTVTPGMLPSSTPFTSALGVHHSLNALKALGAVKSTSEETLDMNLIYRT